MNKKLNLLITAGGTREYIDPVRFISNASSGRMGYALARAAIKAGHRVTLITAPTALTLPKGCQGYSGRNQRADVQSRQGGFCFL